MDAKTAREITDRAAEDKSEDQMKYILAQILETARQGDHYVLYYPRLYYPTTKLLEEMGYKLLEKQEEGKTLTKIYW